MLCSWGKLRHGRAQCNHLHTSHSSGWHSLPFPCRANGCPACKEILATSLKTKAAALKLSPRPLSSGQEGAVLRRALRCRHPGSSSLPPAAGGHSGVSSRWQPQMGAVLGYWGQLLIHSCLFIPSHSLVLAESASLLYRILNTMPK